MRKQLFISAPFFFVMVLHFNDLWLTWLSSVPVWKPTYCVTEMCADENINLLPIRNLLNHIVCACVKSNLYYFPSPLRELISYARIGWFEPTVDIQLGGKKALAANEAAAHAITSVGLVGGTASIIKTSHCLYLTELCDNEMKIDTDIRRRSSHWINSFQRAVLERRKSSS